MVDDPIHDLPQFLLEVRGATREAVGGLLWRFADDLLALDELSMRRLGGILLAMEHPEGAVSVADIERAQSVEAVNDLVRLMADTVTLGRQLDG